MASTFIRVDALFASTLNTRTFGAGMPAVPHARIDDGRLNLLLAGDLSLLQTLLLLPRLLVGKHLSHSKVRPSRFKRCRSSHQHLCPSPQMVSIWGLAKNSRFAFKQRNWLSWLRLRKFVAALTMPAWEISI